MQFGSGPIAGKILTISLAFVFCLIASSAVYAQGTAFTYQGRLTDNGNPADGTFDMQFKLFNLVSGGTQQGSTITNPMVQVENGVFSVQLNFGACASCFNGAARFLEISIRPAGSPDPYTVLSPRQPITSAPYAMRAADAGQLGGIAASGFIQNTTMQQIMTNFNIGGNGTVGGTLSADIVNAATRYDIGGFRVLSAAGTRNLFVGLGAGTNNMSGTDNSFFGSNAGRDNQTGSSNSFFGSNAGISNTAGENSFFGALAGQLNNSGAQNAFFGSQAGSVNQTGSNNAFFGASAGTDNTASNNSFFGSSAGTFNAGGTDNSFFGTGAGALNVSGNSNAFFGSNAGFANTVSGNSFFGANAGDSNTTGNSNSFFGFNAGQANQTGLQNAFFGYQAGLFNTASDNSFFGANAGQLNTLGTLNAFFGANAGASNTIGGANSFFGRDAGLFNTASRNSFFGSRAGNANTSGSSNSFFGTDSGNVNDTGSNNAFFGDLAGNANTTGSNNTIVGTNANVGSGGLNFATAIGAGAVVSNSNSVVLGRGADTVRIPGSLIISTLGGATATHLCHNAGLVSNCSSSLRYKDQLAPFTAGLELINRLRPITFNWKQSGERDLGLAAEEVAAVEPLLVFYNERGQVEGVKYDRINIALINAVRQQQTQIQKQNEEITRQRSEIDGLKIVVCQIRPDADVCK